MVVIKELSFQYKGANAFALENIDFTVKKGEFVGIIGPSGAGKSTLLMSINGIVPHYFRGDYYGSVCVCGQDTVESEPKRLSLHVGSVLQDPEAQIVSETVEEEIAFGLENYGIPQQEIEERITDALAITGISGLRARGTAELSGGQKQRVCIAAAVALRPDILVLDEPTSELDPLGSRQVFETLRRLNRELGITVIIVEQKVMLLAEYCSRIAVMEAGRIVLDGDTHTVLRHYKKLKELGINCPRVVELAALLEGAGLYRGAYPASVREAAAMVKAVTH